eukprot:1157491-Pelagomonas_calceolata.AAC.4
MHLCFKHRWCASAAYEAAPNPAKRRWLRSRLQTLPEHPQVGARLLLDATHTITQRLISGGGGWEGFAALEPPRVLRPGVRVRLWTKATPLLEGVVAAGSEADGQPGKAGSVLARGGKGGWVKVEGREGEVGVLERGNDKGRELEGGARGHGASRVAAFLPVVEVGMDEEGGVQVISSVPEQEAPPQSSDAEHKEPAAWQMDMNINVQHLIDQAKQAEAYNTEVVRQEHHSEQSYDADVCARLC